MVHSHVIHEHARRRLGVVLNRGWAARPGDNDAGRILHHAGFNSMFYAHVCICPEVDAVFLSTTNSGASGIGAELNAVDRSMIRYRLSNASSP